MLFIIVAALIFFGIYLTKLKLKKHTIPAGETIYLNDNVLEDNIAFFRALDNIEKKQFKTEISQFLNRVTITGVNTPVDDFDRILVAASAVIPVFAFPEWEYYNLKEVLLYADTFNNNFQTAGEDRSIMGMVGSGYMEGKMLLSKQALQQGFKNDSEEQYRHT